MSSEVMKIIEQAEREGRKKLLEHEVYTISKHFGLPVPKFGLAHDEDEAVRIAKDIGYPVVLKIVSPDIVHKSDVGGVVLDVKSDMGVREAFRKIMNNVKNSAPNARVVGILVQEMVPYGLEVIVGGLRDAVFGPVIMFGLGGVFVEVLKDVSFRIAPLYPEDIDEMIREIKAYRVLEGYRGEPPRDIDSIKDIIYKVSKLMLEVEKIRELDLNPIMLYRKGEGAKIADARMVIG
ncbi:MAG TPA: acetyl-CoA synthetase [Ignisphaera aggregans]|uniref:Acetyl-CoA synthetase n=1 Tax=Ignisphaera aggregans TaxID=334771 RepID=A0A832YXP2_9CREN|nr:acetyl-CoA synthetase [Ignisphaera aggregans]